MSERLPPDQRPTAAELAEQCGGSFVCPKCGGVLIAYKTITLGTRKIRYRRCRNINCDGRFVTRQQTEQIMREVGGEDSKDGKARLTVIRAAS